MADPSGRPATVWALALVMIFYGLLGTVSGALLVSDPSGSGLGFTTDIRDRLPFQSFLPVGLFLLIVYGLVPFVLAAGAITRKEYLFGWVSRASGYHWSWTGGMLLMLTLAAWLVIEGLLIGLDYAATYFTVIIGLAMLSLLVLPSTRRYYRA